VKVLVSHPHAAAVSMGLAASLEAEGELAAYFTGVAFSDGGWSGKIVAAAAALRPTIKNRIVTEVPARHLRAGVGVELGARMAARLLRPIAPDLTLYNVLFAAHDRVVSWARWPRDVTAIYAYEDAALWTFRRAASAGLARIWDLPTPHYSVTERIFREERDRWPNAALGPEHHEPIWKRHRKDAELLMATRISVASQFTKSSLEGASPRAPVVVVPYGFPVREFEPAAPKRPDRFRVLSVGSQDLRKGTPYLLEAWRRAALRDAELHLVGPLRLNKAFLDGYAGQFKHTPHIPKRHLAPLYAAADLLVFPTLGDGFGLVIQESMCCATPVVTTPCGGGPECITDGVDGWIVPPRDVDALVECLRTLAGNRDRVAAAGKAARIRAERWTWSDASKALTTALER
jgi:glycosyltransferase involved in cell wall biosynthesis